MIFDLWLIYKVRQICRHSFEVSHTLLRIIIFLAISTGILFICIHLNANINSTTCEKYITRKESKEHNNRILTISDHSKVETVLLKEEISKLKMKAFNLDKMIQKMNIELSNVQMSSKKTHLEMADFVSESVGGSVISTPDTESYFESKNTQFHIFGIPIWRPNYFTPRKVIQPWSQAGECWAFHGSHGKIVLELAVLATISHVTMEHIPVSISLTGKIDSAPRKFILFGYYKDQYILIDTFEYNIHGSSTQTFLITKREILSVPFKRVMLEILSNWGNEKYTCIYRFRIHGKSYE
ncbi:PREDICTED: SUN domain-containing protein 1-like isoform X2 [Polistes dominula]|nr:PREDICTED: SUN domain-containing protein 1-like isoform X2 [Polistes dominula]